MKDAQQLLKSTAAVVESATFVERARQRQTPSSNRMADQLHAEIRGLEAKLQADRHVLDALRTAMGDQANASLDGRVTATRRLLAWNEDLRSNSETAGRLHPT